MAELDASSSSGEEIQKFLECPICFETVYPPIFQCSNGHLICSRCKDGIRNTCPICKVEMGDTRSIVLERFLPLLKLPCVYHTKGCNEIVAYEAKKKHEEGCGYRPYKCPYEAGFSDPCKTEGDIPTLLSHLQSSHKFIFHNTSEIQIRARSYWSSLSVHSLNIGYKCFDQHFCIHIERFMGDVCMVYLTIMGDEDLAKKYRYSLRIVDDDTEVNWKGSPRSIRETKEDICKKRDFHFINKIRGLIFRGNHDAVGKIWKLMP